MIQLNSHFLNDEPRCQFQPRCQFKECWQLGYFLYHKKCRKLVKGSIILPVPDIVSHSTLTCHFTLPVFLNGWWESDSRLLSSLMMSHNTVSSIGNIYQTWLIKNSIWISQVQWKHSWCNQKITIIQIGRIVTQDSFWILNIGSDPSFIIYARYQHQKYQANPTNDVLAHTTKLSLAQSIDSVNWCSNARAAAIAESLTCSPKVSYKVGTINQLHKLISRRSMPLSR